MSRQLSPFLIFFLLLFAVEGALISAAAKEVFKDEAGRVIYTIDENGIVSMFENSPTDLTLSVKRGTVEQMRPRLEGVAPATVAAGSSTTLKLRGKNLVGAKVMLGVRQIEMGAYLGLPAMVEVPIQVPANFPPGDVAITVTTPIGITVGSFKVTGPRQVQSGSPNPRDNSKQVISTDAPASCPEGMMGVAAERGGFCIETDQTFSGDLRDAEKICAIAGKRLNDPRAPHWSTLLADRFAAAKAGGVQLHLREEARFELEVRGDAATALGLALANWKIQKEPSDARTAEAT